MRDSPTSVAPPYITDATTHCPCGHHRRDSLVTTAAAANAAVVCPDGNDWYLPSPKPRPNLKSCGFVSFVTYGRALPSTPLSTAVAALETMTASVPCQPRSATSRHPPTRPTV